MATEVKEELPAAASQPEKPENGMSVEEETKEEKTSVAPEKAGTNGTDAQPESQEVAANGHETSEAKPNESISELAASVKQRQRKKVERFLPTMPQSEDRTKELVIPKGHGTKLGDLDNVEFRITRTDAEDLKPLHRIVFGSVGKALTVRKNLRAFSGFDFEKSSPQYEKKMESIKRFTAKGIKFVLQLLDLETKGEREELEQRLMDFLMNPQPSGRKSIKEAAKEAHEKKKKNSERKKAAAEKKKLKVEKKKVATDKKKTTKTEAKKKVKAAKSPTKKAEGGEAAKGKKRPAPADSSESEETGSESDAESNSSSDSDTSMSSAASKSSSAATPSPSPPKKAKSAPAKKASPVKSPAAKKPTKATKSPAQAAKTSSPANEGEPTEEELHSIISEFVSSADLETVTMKNVIAHVFSKFPSIDLTSRKPWIKETVKQLVAAAP